MERIHFSFYLIGCALFFFDGFLAQGVVEVVLNGGSLLGVERDVGGDRYRAFLGVPYAEPPTNARRFKPPEKREPWSGVRTADRSGPSCPHSSRPVSTVDFPQFAGPEDCLNLDIYLPGTMVNITDQAKAVIVYMASDPEVEPDGALLSVTGDVVVVVVNHRIGLLAYLTSGSDEAPGNMGIMDQAVAMEWVQQNIASFGGDPARVTVFGGYQSYVTLHLYTLSDTGCAHSFQRIITSDGATAPRFIQQEPPIESAEALGSKLGCKATNGSQLVQCLRSSALEDLLNSSSVLFGDTPLSPWTPYFDDEFFSQDLCGSPFDVDTVVGFSTNVMNAIYSNEDNGSTTLASSYQQVLDSHLDRAAPRLVNTSLLDTLVRQEYNDWTSTTDANMDDDLATVAGDLLTLIPGLGFINDTQEQSTPSVYLFAFEDILFANYTESTERFPNYLLGIPLRNSCCDSVSDEERQLSMNVIKYLSDFVKYGNPNGNTSDTSVSDPLVWPQYDQLTQRHLVFSLDGLSVDDHLKAREEAFWTITVPEVDVFLQTLSPNTGMSTNVPPGITLVSSTATQNASSLDDPCPTSCLANDSSTGEAVVIIRKGPILWTLNSDHVGIVVKTLLGISIILTFVVIVLVIVVARSRSALRQSREELNLRGQKRGAQSTRSIRATSTAWLWKARDPDEQIEEKTINLDFETKT